MDKQKHIVALEDSVSQLHQRVDKVERDNENLKRRLEAYELTIRMMFPESEQEEEDVC